MNKGKSNHACGSEEEHLPLTDLLNEHSQLGEAALAVAMHLPDLLAELQH